MYMYIYTARSMHRSLNLSPIYYSGRHPCLWCTISSDSMRVPREERAEFAPPTLNSLQADLLIQTAGKGDIKRAKNYNSVIIFPIPLSQVNHV